MSKRAKEVHIHLHIDHLIDKIVVNPDEEVGEKTAKLVADVISTMMKRVDVDIRFTNLVQENQESNSDKSSQQ